MINTTTIIITVTDDKKISFKIEGAFMPPVEVCKVLNVANGQILGLIKTAEESKIITPEH